MKNKIFIGLLLAIALLAGITSQRLFDPNEEQSVHVVGTIGKDRPAFMLKDIHGQMRNVTEWDQKILVINFWATWCPPCRDEIPELIAIQKEYADQGVQIIGIAADDEISVRNYAKEMNIQYPLMAPGIAAMEIAKRYGNTKGSLPYTAFIDCQGRIAHIHNGELNYAELKRIIDKLLTKSSLH